MQARAPEPRVGRARTTTGSWSSSTSWMAQAQAAGVAPLVIFSQSRVQGRTRHPADAGASSAPSSTSCAALPVRARVRRLERGQPRRAAEVQAARTWSPQYYKILRQKLLGCNILPASLLDNPNLVPWTLKLRKAIIGIGQPEPKLWGLHNYSDVNRLKDTLDAQAARGASRARSGSRSPAASSRRPARRHRSTRRARATPRGWRSTSSGRCSRRNPRIERVYFYNWKADGAGRELGLRPRLAGRKGAARLRRC